MANTSGGRARGKRSRLHRTEVITLRLDPRMRFYLDLATRLRRQTVSHFVEQALERALGEMDRDIIPIAAAVWDPLEPDRLVRLALSSPELLTYDEQVVWKYIRECDALWTIDRKERRLAIWVTEGALDEVMDLPLLRKTWEAFQQVAAGEADPSTLPQRHADASQQQGVELDPPLHGPVAVRRASGQP